MTEKEYERPSLEPRRIDRNKILAGIVIAAVLASIVSNCSNGEMSEEEASEPINALFYQNTAQCEADITKQQAEYTVLLKKYQELPVAQQQAPPLSPPMQPQDCAPQMLAAQREHEKTAPVYASIAECQAEGVQCESMPAGGEAGYRPKYGGTYINPYHEPSYTQIGYGGSQRLVYETRPVYHSITSGNFVTPHGREISQTTTGRVITPRHTTFAAPSRPTGTSASGTIKGRSSQGFGSSFKSTGSGGK
jgi:uncharacterized protein YgiB involved in biofilm formation